MNIVMSFFKLLFFLSHVIFYGIGYLIHLITH